MDFNIRIKAGASFGLGFSVTGLAGDLEWVGLCELRDPYSHELVGNLAVNLTKNADFDTTGLHTLRLTALSADTEKWLPLGIEERKLVSDVKLTASGGSTEVVISSTFAICVHRRVTQ